MCSKIYLCTLLLFCVPGCNLSPTISVEHKSEVKCDSSCDHPLVLCVWHGNINKVIHDLYFKGYKVISVQYVTKQDGHTEAYITYKVRAR